MKLKPFALLLVCMLPCRVAAAQELLPRDRPGAPPFAVDLSKEQARILAGIRADDTSSIVEAGHSRDRTFLESLRGALRRQPPDNSTGRLSTLQEALAQLGDTEQLQVAWCLSIDERNYDSDYIAARLARIGGWFSVQVFDYVMSPSGRVHWERALRRRPANSDVIVSSPEYYIAQVFPRVVRNPPLISDKALYDRDAVAATLRAWIVEHRNELSLLQPTGEGVDFSPTACKDGRPRDRK